MSKNRCFAVSYCLMLIAVPAVRAERNVAIDRDVVYGHKVGMALTYDVVRPREDANGAAVMFMVSGGWFSSWFPPENLVRPKSPQANVWEALVDRGFTLYFVRHGSGEKFTVPEAVDDVRRAAVHIRAGAPAYGVDPERLGVFGASAGGHLSLMLGTTPSRFETRQGEQAAEQSDVPIVAAVVAYFPPTELKDYVADEGFRKQFPALVFDSGLVESVSPLHHVTPDDAPILLVHGTHDELVPFKHSQDIQKALDGQGVTNKLLAIEGAEHSFEGPHQQQATAATVAWFVDNLLDAPQSEDRGEAAKDPLPENATQSR